MEIEYYPPYATREFFEYFANLTGKDQQIVENQLNRLETVSVAHAKKNRNIKIS